MRWSDIFRLRIRSMIARGRVEGELDEEMRYHVERQIEANLAAGMTADEARFAAMRAFGGMEQMKEECREARRLGWLEDFARDIRLAARTLAKFSGTSLGAIAALSLGMAGLTAVFAVAYSILWLPLPLPDAGRLVAVSEHTRSGSYIPVSPGDYRDFQAREHVFSSMGAAQWPRTETLGTGSTSDRVAVQPTTPTYLSTLGLKAIAGRLFSDAEATKSERLAVLSEGAWRRDFGADPAAVGRTIRIDDVAYDVIGVAPNPQGEILGRTDIYVPLAIPANAPRTDRSLLVIARRKPGISLSQADAEVALIGRQLAAEHPQQDGNFIVGAEDLLHSYTRFMQPIWLTLLAAVGFLWLIACANVSNLLLAKATGRRAEFAVRRALGARTVALVRQTSAEALLLAVIAITAAALIVRFILDGLVKFASSASITITRVHAIGIHPAVIAFAAGATAVTVALCAVGPALVATSSGNEALKSGGRSGSPGSGERRIREVLVTTEIALALVLLIGTGLFFSSLMRLERTDLGFDPHGVVTAAVTYSGGPARTRADVARYYDQIHARAATAPGAEQTAVSSAVPLSGGWAVYVHRPDRPLPTAGERHWALTDSISPEFLSLMRITLLRGRPFGAADNATAPRVAIINQNLANHYFGDEDPVGKQLNLQTINNRVDLGITPGPVQIVGVVATVHEVGIDEAPFDVIYLPFAQAPTPDAYVMARTLDEPEVASGLASLLSTAGQRSPLIKTMEERVADSLTDTRFNLALIESFALLAVLLAALGIFAVMSHAVTQRTREIGVRMALGARPQHMTRMIVRRTALLAGIGLAAGLALASVVAYAMRDMLYLVPFKHNGLLYRVSAHDPLTLSVACVFVAAVTLVAAWVPARRAARVDPMVALRAE